MADCKNNEEAIIERIQNKNNNPETWSSVASTYYNQDMADIVVDVQDYLINDKIKPYNSYNIPPFIIKLLKDKNNPNYDKNLLPCFVLNNSTFELTVISRSITGDPPLTELPNTIPPSPGYLAVNYLFKYGTNTDPIRMATSTFYKLYAELVKYNIGDEIKDVYDLSVANAYPPGWFALILNSKIVTYQDLKNLLLNNWLNSYLLNRGLNDTPAIENTDFIIKIYKRNPGQSEEPISDWPEVTNLNDSIWSSVSTNTDPFKRPGIHINFHVWGRSSPEIDNYSHLMNDVAIPMVLYQKIDIKEIDWPKWEFNAKNHDKYQAVIDYINPLIAAIFSSEVQKLKDENFWIYNDDYPDFKWNFGADFIYPLNDNPDQFDITNDIADPNAEITEDSIATWTIKTKDTSEVFQGEITLEVQVKSFVKYDLKNVAFAAYNYQAKTTKDTYRLAIDSIRPEILELLRKNFDETKISDIDFELSTENEDTIINQDQIIQVNIKANINSEWLQGENNFNLNLKQFIISKPFRQFKLLNNLNQEFDLQDLNFAIGSSPSDLGIAYQNSFLQIDNNHIFTQKISNLNNINFKLTFLAPNAYDKYYKFIEFLTPNINSNRSLSLNYKISYSDNNLNKNYTCEVFFKSITKTELNALKNLEVQFSLEKVSNWKNLIINQLEFESNTLELENKGQIPAPAIFEVFGNALNPYFILKNENDEIISESLINYDFQESDVLTIDAKVTEQKIIKVNVANKEETNLFDNQDFTKETFIFIPPGKSKLIYQNSKRQERVYVSFEEQYISI